MTAEREPEGVAPGVLVVNRLVVARPGEVIAAFSGGLAYPDGFTLHLHATSPAVDVTAFPQPWPAVTAPRPTRVQQLSGGGSDGAVSLRLWIAPLPAGPLTLTVAWPEAGLEPTEIELDAAAIRAAAAQAEVVFPA